MKDFSDLLNSNISDELLAAYIDGNTSESENQLIESSLNGDSMLSETLDIARDTMSFGSSYDWDIHNDYYGFKEFEIPSLFGDTNTFLQENSFGMNNDFDNNFFKGDSFLSGNDTMGTDDIVSLDSNPFDF